MSSGRYLRSTLRPAADHVENTIGAYKHESIAARLVAEYRQLLYRALRWQKSWSAEN